MGFPVPLKEWFSGELHEFIRDIFASNRAASRPYVNQKKILEELDDLSRMGSFSRKLWGLLCVELWYQTFHDRAETFEQIQ
ncbi:asparagine synthase-related protein, partial [Salmonella enterica]|uniref:asparagine synthase-related protein n=1 Tax=Salmonella enterica TaxID=28901 RepID=UPI0032B50B90